MKHLSYFVMGSVIATRSARLWQNRLSGCNEGYDCG